jgi:hypothetical protein
MYSLLMDAFFHIQIFAHAYLVFPVEGNNGDQLDARRRKRGSRKKEGKGQQEQLHKDTEYQFSAHLDGIFVARHGGRLGYAH